MSQPLPLANAIRLCLSDLPFRSAMAWLMVGSLVSALGFGSASTAVKKVLEGIQYFATGEYESANKAFTEAEVAEPENPTITFDRACSLAASGDVEKARDLFLQTALARDSILAVRSHYNLGCLSAEQGRVTLGDDPITAAPEQRQQGLSFLLIAVRHYRDCLRIDAGHAPSRHNLELIRTFIKHIQSQWEQQDRQEARDEMGLLKFLAMVEERQIGLRSVTRSTGDQPDSPRRRQAAKEATASQQALREEIEPLKDKLHQQFQSAQQGQAGAGLPPDDDPASKQARQAERLLTQLADEAGDLMQTAALSIEGGDFEAAAAQQKNVLDRLNQIFMVVAPFVNVLQHATQQQESLVESSEDSVLPAERLVAEGKEDQEDQSMAPSQPPPPRDFPEQAWQQSRITDWSRMLALKAKSELSALDTKHQPAQPTEDTGNLDPSLPQPSDRNGERVEKSDPAQQLEGLKKSLQKAIELGPEVQKYSESAAGYLSQENITSALPDQQAALKLLKEIAEPLAKQDQQGENQQQKKSDPNREQPEPQKKPPPQPSQDQQQQDQKKNEKPAQEQARSVLRRAGERERQHRDLQKQLQQIIGDRIRVDKDW